MKQPITVTSHNDLEALRGMQMASLVTVDQDDAGPVDCRATNSGSMTISRTRSLRPSM
jgi:hypothetical protein